ncbi:MAG: efflux RND transporter permease subunit, partial [Methanomethylophilus sp.]
MLLERNVSYTLIALLVLCVAGYFIKSCTFGAPPSERMAYRITTEYFGASAEEVERVITIPLENSLGDLPGLGRIQSVSEFGKSRITLIAGTALPPDMLFGDIRE